MATDRLRLYNRALRYLGERRLASLAENAESRRALDEEYEDAVRGTLEAGFWNFASRAVAIAYDPAVVPAFGFLYAYAKPADWVRTVTLSSDEHFHDVERWRDENGVWLSDHDPIYARYISSDDAFGFNLGRWPDSFTDAVAARMAFVTCERITQSDTKVENVMRLHRKALNHALSVDAMNEPPRRPPVGGWAQSRMGGRGNGRWDRR